MSDEMNEENNDFEFHKEGKLPCPICQIIGEVKKDCPLCQGSGELEGTMHVTKIPLDGSVPMEHDALAHMIQMFVGNAENGEMAARNAAFVMNAALITMATQVSRGKIASENDDDGDELAKELLKSPENWATDARELVDMFIEMGIFVDREYLAENFKKFTEFKEISELNNLFYDSPSETEKADKL